MSKQTGHTEQFADGLADSPSIAIGRRDTGFYITRDSDGVPTGIVKVVAGVVDPLPAANAVAFAALQLKSKYQAALINGVHMKADTGLVGLAALAGGATQAAANARANALQAAFATHAASAGTATVDGAHKAADTAQAPTLVAVAVASDLDTSITLVNALLVAYNSHGDSAGVHFSADATLAAISITPDPPVTLANVITALNTILAAAAAHFDLASV